MFRQPAMRGRALLCWAMLFIIPGLANGADELPPPPWLVSRANHVLVGVVLDEAAVRSMLPAGIQPAPGGTGGINIYQVEETYGIPLYSSFYIWADVEGYDAPNGTKARWMLAGAYGPAQVSAALAQHFGYPVREGTARLEWSGDKVRAVGMMAGKEIVLVEITRKKEPCQRVSGTLNEVTRNARTNHTQVIQFPWVGDWCSADLVRVEINAPSSDPFGPLKPVKTLWAGELRAGAWPWIPPIPSR